VRCPTCSAIVPASAAHSHALQFGCSTAGIAAARQTGPDKRFYTQDGTYVVDVTLIGAASRSHCHADVATNFSRREAEKDRLYRAAADANGDHLVTAAATANGCLSRSTVALCRKIAQESLGTVSPKEACAAMRRAAVEQSGYALLNAESKLGIHHHPPQHRQRTADTCAPPVASTCDSTPSETATSDSPAPAHSDEVEHRSRGAAASATISIVTATAKVSAAVARSTARGIGHTLVWLGTTRAEPAAAAT
jgi:hypothetical protein